MRFGIMSPIVSRNPRHDPPAWEAEGTVDDLVAVALAGEYHGFDFMTFPEHVAVPVDAEAVRGATYWAPLPTMGYIAAHTTRLRLATYVVVLGYHHPLELAKSYGTLDRLCGGRVILGVGVGSLEPEFSVLGAPFEGRGERADDALRALRAAWGQRQPSYMGAHYNFGRMVVDPCATRLSAPIWVGGRTRRSLRRAVELGDAWAPFGLPPEVVAAHIAAVPGAAGLDVVLAPEPPVDPLADAGGVRAIVERYAASGATALVFRFRQSSLAHLLDQMEALVALVPEARVG
jgi:probable F420-dependent oxidoreductase